MRPDRDEELVQVHQRRRLDIDGLRGVAVASVLLFHFFPSTARSGFVGVDVFFVISGFVITNLLVRQDLNRRALGQFWGHRIRRILPALILVLLVTLGAGWFVLWPSQYQLLGITTTWSAAMIPNILFWMQEGYFNTEPTANPLLNLWSLGIEEQFYLVWPFALLLLAKVGRRRPVRLFVTVTIAVSASWIGSLLWPVVASDQSRALAGVFYLPWFRAWELLAGAALAITLQNGTPRWLQRLPVRGRTRSLWIILLALIACLFAPMPTQNPALYALPAVILTSAIIYLGTEQPRHLAVLSRGPLLWLGRISYPVYLWHWPLLAFALALGLAATRYQLVTVAGVSILLGWGTKVLLEQPVQRQPVRWQAVSIILGALALTAFLGWTVSHSHGVPSRAKGVGAELANYNYDFAADYGNGTCFSPDPAGVGPWPATCLAAVSGGKNLLLLGDSHGAHLKWGLKQVLGAEGYTISQITQGACVPSIAMNSTDPCTRARKAALIELESGKYDTVVIAGSWREADLADLDETIASYRQAAGPRTRLVLVGPVPTWVPSLPRSWSFLEANEMRELPQFSDRGLDPERFNLDARMRQFAKAADILYVSPLDALCTGPLCLVTSGSGVDGLVTWDRDHLTRVGSSLVAAEVADKLGFRPPAG